MLWKSSKIEFADTIIIRYQQSCTDTFEVFICIGNTFFQ